MVAESREEARQEVILDCGMVMGGNIHSTLPDEEINWAFSTHPEVRMGTDNRSRRTDGVKRSTGLPTAPFFREPKRIKEGAKTPR